MRNKMPVFLAPLLAALLAGLLLLAVPLAGVAAAQEDDLLLDVPKQPVPAHVFKGTLLSGKSVTLKDYAGKVVFLNFWATWCAPCRAEMPAMERLHRKFKDRPFAMIGVNLMEKKARVQKFVDEMKVTFDILLDPDGEIGANYNANNLPLTYIIDKQGRVVRRAIGAREWDKPPSIALFEKLIAE